MTRILTPLVSAIALSPPRPPLPRIIRCTTCPAWRRRAGAPAQEKKKDKAAARPRSDTSARRHLGDGPFAAPGQSCAAGDAAGQPQPASPAMPDMPGMDHSQHQDGAMPDMPGMDHSQHGQTAMPGMQMTGTALPAGNAPPPPPQRPLRRS
jgi:copper resistance protein B